MEKNFSIEKKELSCILINAITSKMLFFYPKGLIETSGNAAWIQMVFVSLISCIFFRIALSLYRRAEMKSIVSLCEEIGGKALKIIIGILLIAILLFNSSLTMRALPESVKTVILPLTPMRLILLVMAVAVAFGAYMGIFSIARIHSVFVPVSGGFLLALFILLIHNTDITNLFPILGKGTYNIFIKGLPAVSIFSDILVFFLLLPLCKNYDSAKSGAKRALIISSVVNILIVLFYNLSYSYPSSQEFLMPVYQMTRLIKIGDFFQRLEAFFEFVWSIGILLYSSLYLFIVCWIFKETFNLKYYKPLILGFSVIMCAVSFFPSSSVNMMNLQKISSLITIPAAFLLPPVIVSIYSKMKSRDTK